MKKKEFIKQKKQNKRIVQIQNKYKINDITEFGSYLQDCDIPNPISWKITEFKDDEILLISEKVLDCKSYHSKLENIAWEQSDLYHWLNNEFKNQAFTPKEQSLIVQPIEILTTKMIQTYFPEKTQRIGHPTAYAINQGAIEVHQASWYWLKDHGLVKGYSTYIDEEGEINDIGEKNDSKDIAVRPCVWITI